jgi:hypothetical protein
MKLSIIFIAFFFAIPTNAEEITVVISNDYKTCLAIANKEEKAKVCSLYDISDKKQAKEVLTVASITYARTFLEVMPEKPACFDSIGFFNCNSMKRNKGEK